MSQKSLSTLYLGMLHNKFGESLDSDLLTGTTLGNSIDAISVRAEKDVFMTEAFRVAVNIADIPKELALRLFFSKDVVDGLSFLNLFRGFVKIADFLGDVAGNVLVGRKVLDEVKDPKVFKEFLNENKGEIYEALLPGETEQVEIFHALRGAIAPLGIELANSETH